MESGTILCDSTAPRPEDRLLVADERGAVLSAEDGRFAPTPLDSRRDLSALCPASIRQEMVGRSLVRCFDERGEVVARLPIVR